MGSVRYLVVAAGQLHRGVARLGGGLVTSIDLRPDGPHSDDYTETLARAFAEVVRVLNHATGSHAATGLAYPQTVYTITGNLSAGAGGFGQLLTQVAAYLAGAHGRIADVRGDLPGAIAAATGHLDAARTAAAVLARELAAAQTAVSGLYLPDDDSEDDPAF
jgi:hypothetical protein